MKISFEPEKFYIVGNNLALDFINSELFELTRENLLSWAIAVNLIDTKKAEKLLSNWDESQLEEILSFRKNLREIVVDLANGKKLSSFGINLINKNLQQTNGYSKLVQTDEGFAKRFEIDLTEPNKILVPIAESMADLLCYGDLSFLRKCERDDCILHFYDTTKNHKRRWCSMAICGNRAKAAKFYQKKKAQL
ncbi:MAG: CGNR zinc finger domain-containing protein [Pyrinomonadaceae bacterium]|nr:CGNR zinc finger domain-containing protein [Pyrinomonadaceae bacterium]